MVVGRTKEIIKLNNLLQSDQSELVAVYGRRRVGKTYLIREIYSKHFVFEMTGYHNGTMKDQLENFFTQLTLFSKRFKNVKPPKDWLTAFHLLEEYLNGLKRKSKKVIFIDEFPWIATRRSKFLMAFEHFWNTYCTKRNDLVVVICGSAASFMVNQVVRNRGGLYNRLSCKIQLMPFNLNETKLFLKSKKINFNNYDIVQLYMAIGGIPHYLNKIKKGESIVQNIDRLCFDKNGDLADEFTEVFTSLFTNSKMHETIIRVLSKTKQGVTRSKLLELCGMGSGGVFSKSLDELVESGFVSTHSPFSNRNKNTLFRISDEYSMFYLKFIEPNKGQGSGTWNKLFSKQTFRSWSGFAFETICLKHIIQIKKELGISAIFSYHSSWINEKAQIDMIIDRDDNIINLCEMKFYNGPFTLNKTDYLSLRNKKFEFINGTKTRKGVLVTMITAFGMTQNANSLELIANDLTLDCLFEAD
jgi:AAA+ ATPase superfamily predicted ATPase